MCSYEVLSETQFLNLEDSEIIDFLKKMLTDDLRTIYDNIFHVI